MKKRIPAFFLTLALCLGLAVPAFAMGFNDITQEDIQSTFTILRNGTIDELEGRYQTKASVEMYAGDHTELAEIDCQVFGQGDSWTITNTGSKALSFIGGSDYTISFTTWQYGYVPGAGFQEVGGMSTIDAEGRQVHAPDEDTRLARLKTGESITIPAASFEGDGPYTGSLITALSIDIFYEDCDPDISPNGFSMDYVFYFMGDDAKKAAMENERKPAPAPSPFTDVPSWCSGAVGWAVENNITTGKTPDRFSPDEQCTNAMILTFLWRAAGTPGSSAPLPVDITGKNLAYAETALRWASEKGMIGADFDPTAYCTRGSAVIYIWKAFDEMGAGGVEAFGDVSVSGEDDTLFRAVSFALASGITNGYINGDGTLLFRPYKVCSRAEIVTLLHRAYVSEARLKDVWE